MGNWTGLAGLALPVAGRNIVSYSVGSDKVKGLLLRNIFAITTNDNHQFAFIVALLLGDLWNRDRSVVISYGGARFGKNSWTGGQRSTCLKN